MKLLLFNQDHGDEHNVPALECFTDFEFREWCEKKMAHVNPNYDQEMEVYNARQEAIVAFQKGLYERKMLYIPLSSFTPEQKLWYDENFVKQAYYEKPSKGVSYLTAYLGNSSDGFSEGYNDMLTGQDFIDRGLVTVHEVSNDFVRDFRRVDLGSLSLCNIFEELDIDEDDYEDYYDENE